MTRIERPRDSSVITPQTDVQQPPAGQRTMNSTEPQQSSVTPISAREASERRAEHNLGGLAQEMLIRDRHISSYTKDSKQDVASEATQMIQRGQFQQAAERLQDHIRSSRSPLTNERLRPLLQQAQTLADMQARGVQNIQHPPTQQNVTDYFRSFRGQPIQTVQERFQNFANAFFQHSGTGPIAIGDRQIPQNWQDLTNRRAISNRYQIDCEGFAYLGQVALGAAGFTNLRFGDMRTGGDNSAFHSVITGTRREGQTTQIVMISNNSFEIGSPQHGESVAAARLRMLRDEFGTIMGRSYGAHDDDGIVQDANLNRSQTR